MASQAWTASPGQDRIIGGVVVAGELILVPCADHTLYALQRAERRPRLVLRDQGAVVGGAVGRWRGGLPGLAGSQLYALDVRTGHTPVVEGPGRRTRRTPRYSPAGCCSPGPSARGCPGARSSERARPAWTVTTTGWVWGNPVADEVAAYFGDLSRRGPAVSLQDGSTSGSSRPVQHVVGQPGTGRRHGLLRRPRPVRCRLARPPTGPRYGKSRWRDPRTRIPLLAGDRSAGGRLGGDVLLAALDPASGATRWTFTPAK